MINLLKDRWLPVMMRDGGMEKIAPWEITRDYASNPPVDITAPRPDFKNAMYQLLIGLLQVAAAPEDGDEWFECWSHPPGAEELEEKFLKYEDCFNLDSPGPAFMQDFDLPETSPVDISMLLISSPGEITLKQNKDFFIKGKDGFGMTPYWAAVALFTLQINAPAGGAGFRTGLRGGGPLTTLVLPKDKEGNAPLWEKLWINILLKEEVDTLTADPLKREHHHIFPWMGETKVSKKKSSEFFPQEANPRYSYFAMPRRIRLDFSSGKKGICSVSGEECDQLITQYFRINYGNNYSEHWKHALSPYKNDKDKEKPDIPRKGQPGGITYRHWLGLVLSRKDQIPAMVVQRALDDEDKREALEKQGCTVWAAAYDMDNMKARCWYESTLPTFFLPGTELELFTDRMSLFVETAEKVAGNTKKQIKEAWFKSSRNIKGDPAYITKAFWQETEKDYYRVMEILVNGVEANTKEAAKEWRNVLKRKSVDFFERWVFSEEFTGLDLKQVFEARRLLAIYNNSAFKKLKSLEVEEEVT